MHYQIELRSHDNLWVLTHNGSLVGAYGTLREATDALLGHAEKLGS